MTEMNLSCGAYRKDGRVCGEPAGFVDRQRACIVCIEHMPRCAVCGVHTQIWCFLQREYRCTTHFPLLGETAADPELRIEVDE